MKSEPLGADQRASNSPKGPNGFRDQIGCGRRSYGRKEDLSDRSVIDRYVARIIVRPDSIDIELMEPTVAPAPSLAANVPVTVAAAASSTCTTVISLFWSVPAISSIREFCVGPKANRRSNKKPGTQFCSP
jgi:hypothetical protein